MTTLRHNNRNDIVKGVSMATATILTITETGPELMRLLVLATAALLVTTGYSQTRCDSMATMLEQTLNLLDSMATEQGQFANIVEDQRSKIDSLATALRRGNYDLAKARKEAEMLRGIMKGYVTTIDSLHRSDRALRLELDELKKGPR